MGRHKDAQTAALGLRFGENLSELRGRVGLSQTAPAERGGLHRTEVALVEHGQRIPRLDTLVKLAGAVEVELEARYVKGAILVSRAYSPLGERFGTHLKRSRRRADLSQQALADLVGMNRVNVSELERGLALPRIDTILKLAAGTNVSTCELLEGMEWRPGQQVEGDFYLPSPPPLQRRRGAEVRR